MTVNIATVIGARPQFIKAALVSEQLRAQPAIKEILIHTGQHYDPHMSDVFFDELQLPKPDHHLGVGSGTHAFQTGHTMIRLEQLFTDLVPDLTLIYGDTNSTLAGALAAAKLNIPIAHVEAGMRCFDQSVPEEVNRLIADRLSTLHLAPTPGAVANLAREGITGTNVITTGDVMYDLALRFQRRIGTTKLETLGLTGKSYVLATVHRAENTDDPDVLSGIFRALAEVSKQIPVIVPLHPRTRKALGPLRTGSGDSSASGLRLIEPASYLEMQELEHHAAVIVTDSGGVQKEAYFHRVPCVTLRERTEWTELVESGWNTLVPPASHTDLLTTILAARTNPPAGYDPHFYGCGAAAAAIVEGIRQFAA